ncbi:hypothetical protein [Streptomyces chartreusis]
MDKVDDAPVLAGHLDRPTLGLGLEVALTRAFADDFQFATEDTGGPDHQVASDWLACAG